MIDEATYQALLEGIYDAAVEPQRLEKPLAALVNAVHASGAHLIGIDRSSGQIVLGASTGFAPLGAIDYVERYARIDPRAPVILEAPVAKWISCHEYLDPHFVEDSEFFQDYLIPYGSRYMSAVHLLSTDTHEVVVGLHRDISQGPLAPDALDLLTRMTPHLQRAVILIQEQGSLQSQWAVAKAMLDTLDYGALICDESGGVLVCNESARMSFEHKDGLALADGRMTLADAKTRARWRSMLLHEHNDAPATGALLVPRPSGVPPYQLILRRIEPRRTLFQFADSGLWSVIVSDPARTAVPTARAIAVLYDLTPAESRLAGLLIAGTTPDDIATLTRVKISTVRTQLASLFAKTGTRRQAELVRLFSAVPALRE